MVLKMKEEESYAFIFLLRRWRHAIGCALIAFILVGNAGRCSKNVPELLLQRRLSYNSEQEAHLATKAAALVALLLPFAPLYFWGVQFLGDDDLARLAF